MVKVFALGVTGYIGGDGFYAIHHAHPEWDYTVLVRSSDKGAKVAAQYQNVRLVYGDLDSADVLKEESAKADIVLHWAHADHIAAANAIVAGLSTRTASNPGYYIHTSGTGILLFKDIKMNVYGEPSTKIYDDYDNIKEMVEGLPHDAPHRDVDEIVLEAGTKHSDSIKTAIVCPPTIYGPGRGPDNQRSAQVPELSRATIERGQGFQVGEGKAYWTEVHVQDLSDLYLKLAEAAANGGKPATWGAEGYYFAENGEFQWGDVARQVAAAAHKQGLINTADITNLSGEEANKLQAWGGTLWGRNSRARAIRARRLLGWEPHHPSLKEEIPHTVQVEAVMLGKVKGHAEKAAGTA